MLRIKFRIEIEYICSFSNVINSPERPESRRERFSDKVIITVSIALILLGRIVHTGVSGVLGRILLLAFSRKGL